MICAFFQNVHNRKKTEKVLPSLFRDAGRKAQFFTAGYRKFFTLLYFIKIIDMKQNISKFTACIKSKSKIHATAILSATPARAYRRTHTREQVWQ